MMLKENVGRSTYQRDVTIGVCWNIAIHMTCLSFDALDWRESRNILLWDMYKVILF